MARILSEMAHTTPGTDRFLVLQTAKYRIEGRDDMTLQAAAERRHRDSLWLAKWAIAIALVSLVISIFAICHKL